MYPTVDKKPKHQEESRKLRKQSSSDVEENLNDECKYNESKPRFSVGRMFLGNVVSYRWLTEIKKKTYILILRMKSGDFCFAVYPPR